ncbi:hypothetical protein GCM10009801_29040 [Streptomyces albiaxialis]|uniref:DUF1648 domain-containing protein n=1 Tax=Streptomyces albiaxialis TaxID=329523 RepID=A0ABP5HIL3_9ACTN
MPEATYTPPRFPWVWLAASVSLLAGMAAWGAAAYPHLPDRIPQHIGTGGVDAWTDKSVGAAFTLVFVYAGVTALLAATAALLLRATPAAELPAGEPRFAVTSAAVGKRPATRASARRGAVSLLVLNFAIGLSFVVGNIVQWRTSTTSEVPWWFFLGMLVPIAGGTLLTLAVAWQDRGEKRRLGTS